MEFRKSKSVRIRLCFEEQSMLSKVQADQGLAKSWYLVDTNVLSSIANLATRIALDYNLGQSCPRGIALEVIAFVAAFAHLLEQNFEGIWIIAFARFLRQRKRWAGNELGF